MTFGKAFGGVVLLIASAGIAQIFFAGNGEMVFRWCGLILIACFLTELWKRWLQWAGLMHTKRSNDDDDKRKPTVN